MKHYRNILQLFAEEIPEGGAEQESPASAEAAEAQPAQPEKYGSGVERVLDALAQHYGVTPGDSEALAQAISRQSTGQQMPPQEIYRGADRIYDGWIRESEQLKQLYPDFDLRREMQDPRFFRLLGSRVDMQTAFEVVHNREIIPAAMQYAARTVEQRLANSMRTGADRPTENGIRSQGAVMLGSDVSHMSRQDYDRVCAMVERGERVSFG